MNEKERTMVPEFNPYDLLTEPETKPVKSPVILGNAGKPEKKIQGENAMEIIPLASKAIYNKIPLKEWNTVDTINFEIEEDILVPDTFPDMEMILNMDANAGPSEVNNEGEYTEIKGRIKIETMYRSDETYASNIAVVPAELTFSKQVKKENTLYTNIHIRKIEYRIVNERKYKVKLYLSLDVKSNKETEKMFFEGIEDETLHLHKEQIKMINFVSCRNHESDINEELLINDEKIRPVKILKSKVVAADNHRQLTKEKLVLNQTLWVRIVYLAEIASKGNLSNQPMLFLGKIDCTQFITLGKNEEGAVAYTTYSDTSGLKVEVNRASNGFEINGEMLTKVEFYDSVENEIVTDFYHNKEDMTCDYKPELVCENIDSLLVDQIVNESISLQQDSDEGLRIVYMDASVVDPTVNIENKWVSVRGKLQLEAIVINEGDYTIAARKNCDFTSTKELSVGANERAELKHVFIKEMTCDISGGNVNVTAQVQAMLNIYNETEINLISNPCIIRKGEPEKCYPITIHTVAEGETVWDIGKKYKVSENQITRYNTEGDIKPGKKIIIVK